MHVEPANDAETTASTAAPVSGALSQPATGIRGIDTSRFGAALLDAQGDDLAGRLALAAGRLNRRIRSSAGGLSHGQLSALSTIVRQGPLRPSELAAIEVVAAPTVTRLISDLHKRGLVARQPDPDDRRSFFVNGTAAGIELLLRAGSDRARTVAAILSELTPEQVATLRSALPVLEAAADVTTPDRRNDAVQSS